jgi:hypothetical protein
LLYSLQLTAPLSSELRVHINAAFG